MKEVLPMWRMCRIIKKHRAEWVTQRTYAQVIDSEKDLIKKFSGTEHFDAVLNQAVTLRLLHGEDHQGDLKVYRNGVLYTYISNFVWKDPNQIVNISTDSRHQEELLEASAILRLCINHKPRFICRDRHNLLYLSGDGESFASDWYGLFKQYIIEMGPTWAIVSGVFIACLPYLHKIVLWGYSLMARLLHHLQS